MQLEYVTAQWHFQRNLSKVTKKIITSIQEKDFGEMLYITRCRLKSQYEFIHSRIIICLCLLHEDTCRIRISSPAHG